MGVYELRERKCVLFILLSENKLLKKLCLKPPKKNIRNWVLFSCSLLTIFHQFWLELDILSFDFGTVYAKHNERIWLDWNTFEGIVVHSLTVVTMSLDLGIQAMQTLLNWLVGSKVLHRKPKSRLTIHTWIYVNWPLMWGAYFLRHLIIHTIIWKE